MSTVLNEGKTKRIVATDNPGLVELQAVDRLTGGDAAKVAEIGDIGRHKTRQAANVFTLLNNAGVKTSLVEQMSDTSLLCRNCDMLPLEFVVRRYSFGSFLKRLKAGDPAGQLTADGKPFRFDKPLFELFHKESAVMPPLVDAPVQMDEGDARDQFLVDGRWADGVYTDPYVDFESDPSVWGIYSAKSPIEGAPLLTRSADLDADELRHVIDNIVVPCFETLEAAWAKVETAHGPVQLVDMKVELGRDVETGDLLLADVIDNDSWRVWPGADPKNQLDKQAFRDGEDLSLVSEKYELVSRLTESFRG